MPSKDTLPRRQPPPQRIINRENTELKKKPITTLALGSRFSKYGPLDSDLSTPKQNRPPLTPKSNPLKPKILPSASLKSNNSLEASRSRTDPAPRPKPLSRPGAAPVYKDSQLMRKPMRPEVNNRQKPLDSEGFSESSRAPLPSRRPTEPVRKRKIGLEDDLIDEDYAKNNISSIIGSIFGYDRSKYRDDFSDDNMEVSASRVRQEELRSARIGREEDELEEELERQRLERIRQRKKQR